MFFYAYLDTPMGLLEIMCSEKGLRSVKKVEKQENGRSKNELAEKTKQQLLEYFDGKRENFDVPLDWTGASAFYRKVWEQLLRIPYGHTTTYKRIAETLGDKNAVRAVGLANRNNPIAVIVPCHRVVAKNGDLQGYFYGLDTKRMLLELENPLSFARQGELF